MPGMDRHRRVAKATGRYNLNGNDMAKANVTRNSKGDGSDLINLQRNMDEAKNERMKSERDTNKIDPAQASRKQHTDRKHNVDMKKSGASKH